MAKSPALHSLSWLFSISSVLFLTLLYFTFDIACGYLALNVAHYKLKNELLLPESQIRSLQRMANVLTQKLSFSGSEIHNFTGYGKSEKVSKMLQLLSFIKDGKVEEAMKLARNYSLVLGQETSQVFHKSLQVSSESLSRLQKNSLALEANTELLDQNRSRQIAVAQDFAELFSLKLSAWNSDSEVLATYTRGVLLDLPLLEGLPDNIGSLQELKLELERSGGKVRLSGENVHEQFMQRLSDTRASLSALILEHGELSTIRKGLINSNQELLARLNNHISGFEAIVQKLMSEETEPLPWGPFYASNMLKIIDKLIIEKFS